MRTSLPVLALALAGSLGCATAKTPQPPPSLPKQPLHQVGVRTIDGEETTLEKYRGQALLIVNTASKCGYTPQYEGLEALHQQYKDRGFTVLAFPANDFLGQEPGTEAEIKAFCTLRYKTTFPLFAKVVTKGEGQHPLYRALTTTPGFEGDISWNFNKFLVDPEGRVVARFDSKVAPLSPELTSQLEKVLPAG